MKYGSISRISKVALFLIILTVAGITLASAALAEVSAYDKILVYDQYGGGWASKGLNYGRSGGNNMENGGCHIFAYAHAIQWLTGNKLSYGNRESLIDELINVCDIPWGPTDYNSTNPQALYNNHIVNNYGAQEVSVPGSASALSSHFASGGVIIANPGGHYILAVGSTYADYDGNGSTEMYVHIVDSSCQSTWWRTNQNFGGALYTFDSHSPITGYRNNSGSYVNGTQGSKWGGGEYWVPYSVYVQYRRDRAYLPGNQSGLSNPQWVTISANKTSVYPGETVAFEIHSNVTQGYNGSYFDMYVWDSTAYYNNTYFEGTGGTWFGVAGTDASYTFNDPGDYYVRGRVHNTEYDIYSDPLKIHVIDNICPTVSDIQVRNVTSSGYEVTCNVSDNLGVTKVAFPTIANGESEFLWRDGQLSGNVASFYINVEDHSYLSGNYRTEVYAFGAEGNCNPYDESIVISVEVPSPIVYVTDITLSSLELNLIIGDETALTATVSPSNATNANVAWASSDTSVASVNEGIITAVGTGIANITCAAIDGSGIEAICKVIVNKPIPDLILPAALKEIDEEAFMGIAAESIQLSNGVERILSRAFADCPVLRKIVIPDSVEYISADAFSGTTDLVIYGIDGSYAQYYAGRYGYEFVDVH